MNVGIIGGGPSGIMAALTAAKSGHKVTILEHNNRIGKKLLTTGSGKCNLTNEDMHLDHFHGGDIKIIEHVLSAFDKDMTLQFFSEYGLYTRNRNGYIYPFNEQASAVLDILRAALRIEQVNIITNCNVSNIKIINNKNGIFKVNTEVVVEEIPKTEVFYFDKLIIACGSKAAPKTGSDGTGYTLAKALGHSIVNPLPALCGLKCDGNYFKSIKGIRCRAAVKLYENNNFLGSDEGEVQINDYGFSGIPVMQLSYLAAQAISLKKNVKLCLSFMPEYSEDSLYRFIKERIANTRQYDAAELLLSMLHKNLAMLILKKSNINPDVICENISDAQLRCLCKNIISFEAKVLGTNSFQDSQVCSGGIDLKEVNNYLQSKLVNGLYFAGEILDVNGDCGGYNLQWAWSSGHMAGSLL